MLFIGFPTNKIIHESTGGFKNVLQVLPVRFELHQYFRV